MTIARDGYPFIVGTLLPGIILLALYLVLGGTLLLVTTAVTLVFSLVCTVFFRNPSRIIPRDEKVLLSPADGKVLQVKQVEDDFVGYGYRVDIFLSILDVHLNRIPFSGVVKFVSYRPGKFISAFKDKASADNERTDIGIAGRYGRFRVAQIAGSVARRIVCRLKEDDEVVAGQIYGMIRFGSRTEITFPNTFEPSVRSGQHVRAGETIIGRLIENGQL